MSQAKPKLRPRYHIINTTVGEFVEAVYEAAMEEYMDEVIARRIAMQMLIRKLRMQHKINFNESTKLSPKEQAQDALKKSRFAKKS